jgi:deoxycytidylate deaminase
MKQMAMDAAIAVRLESDLRVKVGACLVRGKRIISVAANKSGGSKKHGYQWSRHAELRCVLRGGSVAGSDIYVARLLGHSTAYGFSRPCAGCETLLREAGIRFCYYTTEEGVEMMRLN